MRGDKGNEYRYPLDVLPTPTLSVSLTQTVTLLLEELTALILGNLESIASLLLCLILTLGTADFVCLGNGLGLAKI